MTSATPPPDAAQEENRTAPAPLPFYKRSWFWVLMGMLLGLILLLALFSCQEREPVPQAEPAIPQKDPNKEAQELLDLQRAQNEGLEEELRRLQALLKEDPCVLPGILGQSPKTAPVAPSYGGGTAPAIPTGNGTAQAPPAGRNSTAPIPSPAPPPATVSELMDGATVFVLSLYNNDAGMGSGFFVAPGIIATNRHVAQGPDAKIFVGNKNLGGMKPAQIIAFSPDESRDYALLRIDGSLAGKAPVLQITDGAQRTERVSAWGFPGYITEIDPKLQALIKGDSQAVPEVVFSEGAVSVVLDRTPPAILHTAVISQGNSGGPLVNSQGVVVGINTFIRRAGTSYSQTNIALPGSDLARFMKENGVQPSMAAK